MKPNGIVIHEKDNTAVALFDIKNGETVCLSTKRTFPAVCDIPFSHKILTEDVVEGDSIIKYGEVIGKAGEDMKRGSWIHTHNMKIEEEERT